jgi:hypothetical protein
VNSENTQLAPGDGCGCSTDEATAIEIGHFGRVHARFVDSVLKTLAARKRKSEMSWALFLSPFCGRPHQTDVDDRILLSVDHSFRPRDVVRSDDSGFRTATTLRAS